MKSVRNGRGWILAVMLLCLVLIIVSCGKKEQVPVEEPTPEMTSPDTTQVDTSAVQTTPETTTPETETTQ